MLLKSSGDNGCLNNISKTQEQDNSKFTFKKLKFFLLQPNSQVWRDL